VDGRPRFPPGLAVAVAVASVSFAAPLFKEAQAAGASAIPASFWRLAIAVALLLPFAGRSWSSWRSYGPRDWSVVALCGIALGAHFALWVTSLGMTSIAAATVLVTLQAVFVALGGHFLLGDRLLSRAWMGVGLAVVGAGVITYGDARSQGLSSGTNPFWGDVLALAAGIGSAVYMLIGRRLRQGRGLVEYVLPVYAAAAVALALAAVLSHQGHTAFRPTTNHASNAFVVFVLLAAVPMLGGHTMANWALKYLPAHTIATWILLEPVGAALVGYVHFHEAPTPFTWLGGGLVLLGAGLTTWQASSAVAATEPPG
jgi:drug/metabolite transporter (DMT)-like permease